MNNYARNKPNYCKHTSHMLHSRFVLRVRYRYKTSAFLLLLNDRNATENINYQSAQPRVVGESTYSTVHCCCGWMLPHAYSK